MQTRFSPPQTMPAGQSDYSFKALLAAFEDQFNDRLFPDTPAILYDAIDYALSNGGKRVRPVLCLMGNTLVGPLEPDAFLAAHAVELYHNFTLVHDDIMDRAPLRRGRPTVHIRYNTSTAILAGDTLQLYAFEYLNCMQGRYRQKVAAVFLEAALGVCEGQQMDLDMENMPLEAVSYPDYLVMITMKTSVLLAASLQMGAMIGGAGEEDQQHLYAFGKNIGIAFQVQDDYLDAFGDPGKFGKQVGGDIITNKKTFLLLKARELCSPAQQAQLQELLALPGDDAAKVPGVLQLYKDCKVDEWALAEKQRFQQIALQHLENVAAPEANKKPLLELADLLLNRGH
ncbi:polyprenyl synthetase family protein [Chitinophaga japonensis]|uniref:Geranylgeranyl diphosphate synthase type II n=1 Tax=Chitinophaga japonensis TaxID=104662 RepID=A0A562TFP2_CHIJA|nr:polyprenyl synthetase family protein [Chitinophaga japonensis]TWI92078.1 geranylgeranyl diphosphate synthase type II [Chitinophaga japonensis]